MFAHYRLISSCLLILALCPLLFAQNDKSAAAQRTTPIVTIAATGSQVRITAPSSIIKIQLAVYSAAGEKLFENNQNGNVLDYAAQDKAGVRLAPGNYLCVVKVKSLSGKLSEKLGQLSVQDNQVTAQPAETNQLTVAQTQIVPPDSEATPLTAPAENETEASAVIAHNGAEGQMIRGRGALSFRIGDFFRARDKEQMRLSEDGNLDVAGTIRAQRFVVVKPNSADKNGTNTAADSVESVQPLVWGTGTTGKLTKWMDGTGGLTDSIMTESGNQVGIGTTSPSSILELKATTPILTFNADTNDSYHGLNWLGAGYGANVLGSMLMNGHSGDLQIKSGYPGYGGFVSLHTNGLERMRATANGNIGIGTANPNSLLELNATTPILSFNANNRDSYHGMNWLANGYGPIPLASILMNGQSGELQLKSGYPGWGGFFTFHTNGIERMRLDQNGKLTVNGLIESTAGGIKFPDGTTQTTAGGKSIFNQTTLQTGANFNIDGTGYANIFSAAVIESKLGGFRFPDGTIQKTAAGGGGIANQTTLQAGANFNIDGTGKANIFDAAQYNILGQTIMTTPGGGIYQVAAGNIAVGKNAGVKLRDSAVGSGISLFGTAAGENTTANLNSFFGFESGHFSTTGSQNSFFGAESGLNTTGALNSFFGTYAGTSNTTGNNNTLIGVYANVGAANLNYATAIGAAAKVNSSDTIVLGKVAGNYITGEMAIPARPADTVIIPGSLSIGATSAPADRLDVNGDIRVGDTASNGCLKNNNGGTIVGTCSSDLRFKRNLQTFGPVLNRVTRLQPYYFFWRASEFPEKRFGAEREAGLVAQQVEQVMPELVTTDKDGYKMVDYSKLPLLTLQAMKELKADNDALQQRTLALQQELKARTDSWQQQNAATQRENAALKARLDRLERSVNSRRHNKR